VRNGPVPQPAKSYCSSNQLITCTPTPQAPAIVVTVFREVFFHSCYFSFDECCLMFPSLSFQVDAPGGTPSCSWAVPPEAQLVENQRARVKGRESCRGCHPPPYHQGEVQLVLSPFRLKHVRILHDWDRCSLVELGS